MPHDIIDNRNAKLVEYLSGIMGTAKAAKMATGNLFLSGWGSGREELLRMKQDTLVERQIPHC